MPGIHPALLIPTAQHGQLNLLHNPLMPLRCTFPHMQISSCDNILATMEDMLGKFQADLGNISTEIRALQEQSQTMSIKLKNRKGTEQKLSQFIESVAIPPALIEGTLQAEVDDTFHEHLLNLHKKLNFLEKNEAAQNSAAYKDVAPELEKLRVKAISKSRDYLMQRIYALRKPKTNIQILQQNVLLKYKYLVTFLRLHGGEVFNEVRAAYIDTLSRVLSSHFRAYLAAIERLKVCAFSWRVLSCLLTPPSLLIQSGI